jgi:hypothetical protein
MQSSRGEGPQPAIGAKERKNAEYYQHLPLPGFRPSSGRRHDFLRRHQENCSYGAAHIEALKVATLIVSTREQQERNH